MKTHFVFLCAAKQYNKKIINPQCNFCSYINYYKKPLLTRLVLFKISPFPFFYDENITMLAAGKSRTSWPHFEKAGKRGATHRPP